MIQKSWHVIFDMMNNAEKNTLVRIGLNLRKARERKGISRVQLAFEANTTERQLARIEYGEINSGILVFVKFSALLNIHTSELFEGIDFKQFSE
jgi:transcriptional regulator with XRE-family HTH domain